MKNFCIYNFQRYLPMVLANNVNWENIFLSFKPCDIYNVGITIAIITVLNYWIKSVYEYVHSKIGVQPLFITFLWVTSILLKWRCYNVLWNAIILVKDRVLIIRKCALKKLSIFGHMVKWLILDLGGRKLI
jgi:hypothetical protein